MKITKTQLKQIIKEEIDHTLKEAGSPRMPKSPGLLRAIWDMLKDEFDSESDVKAFAREDDEDMETRHRATMAVDRTPEEEEEAKETARRSKARVASSARDAYYHGGTYDPTLEEMIKEEIEKILKR
jgi:hypothetical protein